MRRARVGLVLASLLAGPAARADAAGATPVHVSYTASPACPDESAFLEMVARDGTAIALAGENEAAQSFEITVEASVPVAGRLRVRRVDGTESERAVTGPHCDEVVRSLAVIVALAVDTDAASPIVSKLTIGATGARSGPAAGPLSSDAANPAPARARRRVADAPESNIEPPDPWRPRWRAGASFEGGASAGPSPAMGSTIALYGEVMHETPDLFAPSLRLGVAKAWGSTANLKASDLTTVLARVDGCPWRLVVPHPWSDDTFTAQMCARADVGWLDAAELGGPEVRQVWIATGGLLRLRWVFPSAFVEAEGGADFPLTRYRFSSPYGFDFEVPWATGMVEFGFGLLFL